MQQLVVASQFFARIINETKLLIAAVTNALHQPSHGLIVIRLYQWSQIANLINKLIIISGRQSLLVLFFLRQRSIMLNGA